MERPPGFIRIFFHEGTVGSSWIYDVPVREVHALEKFILDNTPGLMEYETYVISSYIYIRFFQYQVWEYFPDTASEVFDDDVIDDLMDESDYVFSAMSVSSTQAGIDDPTPEAIAKTVLLMYLRGQRGTTASTYQQRISKMKLPRRLVDRFRPESQLYDVTREIGTILNMFL